MADENTVKDVQVEKLSCTTDNTLLSEFISDKMSLGFYKIKKLISGGQVKVNGVRTRADARLEKGDEVVVYADSVKLKINVVYRDDNVLFVEKPSGMEVLGEKSLESLVNKFFCASDIKAVNRLDRNTTGIVCFAKNQKSLEQLLNCFKQRQVDKFYEALVYGIPKQKQADLKAFLFKDAKQSRVYVSEVKKTGYLPIETIYKVKEEYGNYSRLQIKLVTGRTHQIRAHMAYIGHPILGDGKYSSNKINGLFPFKSQALCAVEYKFKLPAESFLSYLNNIVIKTKAPF